jgi:hypothetical protein
LQQPALARLPHPHAAIVASRDQAAIRQQLVACLFFCGPPAAQTPPVCSKPESPPRAHSDRGDPCTALLVSRRPGAAPRRRLGDEAQGQYGSCTLELEGSPGTAFQLVPGVRHVHAAAANTSGNHRHGVDQNPVENPQHRAAHLCGTKRPRLLAEIRANQDTGRHSSESLDQRRTHGTRPLTRRRPLRINGSVVPPEISWESLMPERQQAGVTTQSTVLMRSQPPHDPM